MSEGVFSIASGERIDTDLTPEQASKFLDDLACMRDEIISITVNK